MDITRVGSQPSNKGPADWFTGTVRIDPLFQAKAPARAAGGERHVRAGGPDGLAHAPAGADAHRHGRLAAGFSKRAARSRRSDLVTWSGSLPA